MVVLIHPLTQRVLHDLFIEDIGTVSRHVIAIDRSFVDTVASAYGITMFGSMLLHMVDVLLEFTQLARRHPRFAQAVSVDDMCYAERRMAEFIAYLEYAGNKAYLNFDPMLISWAKENLPYPRPQEVIELFGHIQY